MGEAKFREISNVEMKIMNVCYLIMRQVHYFQMGKFLVINYEQHANDHASMQMHIIVRINDMVQHDASIHTYR